MEAEDFAIRVRNAFLDGRDPRTVVTAEDCGGVAAIEWGSLTSPGMTPGMPLAQQTQLWNAWQQDECAKAARFWELLEQEHQHPERPLQRVVLAARCANTRRRPAASAAPAPSPPDDRCRPCR